MVGHEQDGLARPRHLNGAGDQAEREQLVTGRRQPVTFEAVPHAIGLPAHGELRREQQLAALGVEPPDVRSGHGVEGVA